MIDRDRERLVCGLARVGEQCTRFVTRHESSVVAIAAIGERLRDDHEPAPLSGRGEPRARLGKHQERPTERDGAVGNRVDDGTGMLLIGAARVIERSVRLDVANARAGVSSDSRKRTDLFGDVGAQDVGRNVEPATAEPLPIAVGHLRTDSDVALGTGRRDAPHGLRVTGVEPARHVCARDEGKERVIVGVALADVAVEVDHGT